jgi:hypothetical protein
MEVEPESRFVGFVGFIRRLILEFKRQLHGTTVAGF